MMLSPPFDGLDSLSPRSEIQSEIDRVTALEVPPEWQEAKEDRLAELALMMERALD
jgi:hypothetical protein